MTKKVTKKVTRGCGGARPAPAPGAPAAAGRASSLGVTQEPASQGCAGLTALKGESASILECFTQHKASSISTVPSLRITGDITLSSKQKSQKWYPEFAIPKTPGVCVCCRPTVVISADAGICLFLPVTLVTCNKYQKKCACSQFVLFSSCW